MARSILFALLLLWNLSGCTPLTRFEKGNLVAFAQEINGSQERLYFLIRINDRRSPNASTPAFTIRFPNSSQFTSIAELNATLTAQYLQSFVPPPQWPAAWKKEALTHPAYEGDGIYIAFDPSGRLIYLSLCSHCQKTASPSVGTADGSVFFPLPLTQSQMIEIFGAPSRMYDVAEVRY